MINLPLFHSLDVTDYGLYPGEDPVATGLHIQFEPGLTLVLGANGLGKTTLVTMLYRLLTGPSDIPVLLRNTPLGNASLEIGTLRENLKRTFADRVADNAEQAVARLEFDVGSERVSVERNLRDLSLRSFNTGGSGQSSEETLYQDEMARLADVSTFSDWILLLRYIVFYFEDRRSLVWDPTAQRQLLRILFLEPNQAQNWTEHEREILSRESLARNMSSIASNLQRNLRSAETRPLSEPEIRQELREQEEILLGNTEALDETNTRLPEIVAGHERARLRFLTLDQRRESLYRELENTQFLAIKERLPQHSDSANYIFAQLFTQERCLACGNNDVGLVESVKFRIENGECIVCGAPEDSVGNDTPISLTDERFTRLERDLQETDTELEAARRAAEEFEIERYEIVKKIQELRTDVAERQERIDRLLEMLPPEEGQFRSRQQEFFSLRAQVEEIHHELEERRVSFEEFIREANTAVSRTAFEVQNYFGDYAQDFLFEDCRLIWSPRPARLGQTGRSFNFPAFGLELGGSDFGGTLRRSSPEDVSESQREFIDVSFRMALAKAATRTGVTSLVMDAPESSLDMVFEDRAASVLGAFGRREAGNRLIVTSNLISGKLIPNLLRKAADEGDRRGRVVDLFVQATPTAAVVRFRDEYNNARDELLDSADDHRTQP